MNLEMCKMSEKKCVKYVEKCVKYVKRWVKDVNQKSVKKKKICKIRWPLFFVYVGEK